MTAIDYPTGSETVSFAWFEAVLAVVVLTVLVVVVRRALLALTAHARRPATDATTAVSAMLANAVTDGEPDTLVMRATYELGRLLDLADCRWTVGDDSLPAARLHDDGSVRFGAYRWRADLHGLPLRGVHRPLVAHGRAFGALVLLPRTCGPVSDVQLRGAIGVADVVALCLDDRRSAIAPSSGS